MMSNNIVSFMKKIVKGNAATGEEEVIQRPTKTNSSSAVQEKPVGRPSPGDLQHLTSEEKHILQRVWEKEQEFEEQTQRLKVTQVVRQPCRICRKMLGPTDKSYTCDGCQQRICDDCASYTTECGQEWKCSFCRRHQNRQQAHISRITNNELLKNHSKLHEASVVKTAEKEETKDSSSVGRQLSRQDTRRRPPVERQQRVDVPEETEPIPKRVESKALGRRSSLSSGSHHQKSTHSSSSRDGTPSDGHHKSSFLEYNHHSSSSANSQSSSRVKMCSASRVDIEEPANQSTRPQARNNNDKKQPRKFSTSDSSFEEPLDEEDYDKKKRIKTKKKSKIHKQKNGTGSPPQDICSSAEVATEDTNLLTVQRRNSDSSDLSDVSGDGAHEHRHHMCSRRHGNRKTVHYDSDGPTCRDAPKYNRRLSTQKSYSFDDVPSEGGSTRRVRIEEYPLRNRAMSFDYGDEKRHRALPRIPRSRCRHQDADIKIIIDDVDGDTSVGRHPSWEDRLDEPVYSPPYRSTHSRSHTRKKGSPTVFLSSEDSSETEMPPTMSVRRKLPKTPDRYNRCSGEIGLQIRHDRNRMELMVTLMAAHKLKCRRHPVSPLPRAYCKFRLLPSHGHASRKSSVAEPSVSPEWNKTFIFSDISSDDLLDMCLDVTLWDAGRSENHCFLGESRIFLRRADLCNTPTWYPLSTQTLLLPSYKAGSTGTLVPSTPAHDMARQLLRRGAQREMLQSRSLTDDYPGSQDGWKLVKSSSMDSTYDQSNKLGPRETTTWPFQQLLTNLQKQVGNTYEIKLMISY